MTFRSACVAVVLATACAVGATPPSPGSNLNPNRLRELNESIRECVQRVNSASGADARSQCQEQLCKKLIQAEDYDNALNVANAIYRTPGIDQERKAAHHFLIAQIYSLKMEASQTEGLMRANRLAALDAAKEVIGKNYNEKWKISEAAGKLVQQLEDPKHMQRVDDWVRKRQSGGEDPQKYATAYQQSVSVDKSAGGMRGAIAGLGRYIPGVGRSRSAGSQVSVSAAPRAASSSDIVISDLQQRRSSARTLSNNNPLLDNGATARHTALESPIIINGTNIRRVDPGSRVAPTSYDHAWPTASPQLAQSQGAETPRSTQAR